MLHSIWTHCTYCLDYACLNNITNNYLPYNLSCFQSSQSKQMYRITQHNNYTHCSKLPCTYQPMHANFIYCNQLSNLHRQLCSHPLNNDLWPFLFQSLTSSITRTKAFASSSNTWAMSSFTTSKVFVTPDSLPEAAPGWTALHCFGPGYFIFQRGSCMGTTVKSCKAIVIKVQDDQLQLKWSVNKQWSLKKRHY